MYPPENMKKFLEKCIHNILGREKQRTETQYIRENMQDKSEKIEGGYMDENIEEE